jgi:hypothetical protein
VNLSTELPLAIRIILVDGLQKLLAYARNDATSSGTAKSFVFVRLVHHNCEVVLAYFLIQRLPLKGHVFSSVDHVLLVGHFYSIRLSADNP